jgi:hypothetical protein
LCRWGRYPAEPSCPLSTTSVQTYVDCSNERTISRGQGTPFHIKSQLHTIVSLSRRFARFWTERLYHRPSQLWTFLPVPCVSLSAVSHVLSKSPHRGCINISDLCFYYDRILVQILYTRLPLAPAPSIFHLTQTSRLWFCLEGILSNQTHSIELVHTLASDRELHQSLWLMLSLHSSATQN